MTWGDAGISVKIANVFCLLLVVMKAVCGAETIAPPENVIEKEAKNFYGIPSFRMVNESNSKKRSLEYKRIAEEWFTGMESLEGVNTREFINYLISRRYEMRRMIVTDIVNRYGIKRLEKSADIVHPILYSIYKDDVEMFGYFLEIYKDRMESLLEAMGSQSDLLFLALLDCQPRLMEYYLEEDNYINKKFWQDNRKLIEKYSTATCKSGYQLILKSGLH